MEQGTVTVVVASLGIFGTLCGNFGGLFLSRSWQREQWMRDRRNEEFRELLEALTASMLAENEAMCKTELTAKEREDRRSKTADFFQVVDTRIFTFADVKRLDLKCKWQCPQNDHTT